MLPVSHAGHDDFLKVVHYGVPRFRLEGCRFGQNVLHVARLNVGSDPASVYALQVVGDVVDHLLATFSKLARTHGTIFCSFTILFELFDHHGHGR